MKVNESPILPKDINGLHRFLTMHLREVGQLINQLSDGQLSGTNNATASVPTAGTYQIGDQVKNSAPSELGVAGSKYVILGWVCTSSNPLVFKECRVLTGA